MNIEKEKSKFLSFFNIHHDGECQFFFDFRFSICNIKSNVKIILTFVFFDIHQDGECHFFFFFFFFRLSIFEFEFRKAKNENQTKLLLICTCILNRKIHY